MEIEHRYIIKAEGPSNLPFWIIEKLYVNNHTNFLLSVKGFLTSNAMSSTVVVVYG